jgi:fimbrial chaperone protein
MLNLSIIFVAQHDRSHYMQKSAFGCAALLILSCLSSQAVAYSFSPQLLMLETLGEASSGLFFLENKDSHPVAIELSIQEHHKDQNGNSIVGSVVDQDFIIYPAQLILMPNEQATVQIKWVSTKPIHNEQAFSVHSQQVEIPAPIVSSATKGVSIGFTILINYEARLYVAPPATQAELIIESVTEHTTINSKTTTATQTLDITLHNQGRRHADLSTLRLQLSQDPKHCKTPETCTSIDVNTLANTKTHLLAGDRRNIEVARPTQFSDKPIFVTIK